MGRSVQVQMYSFKDQYEEILPCPADASPVLVFTSSGDCAPKNPSAAINDFGANN